MVGTNRWSSNPLEMVRPDRFELPTSWFVARRSIQLSYGRKWKQNLGRKQTRALSTPAFPICCTNNLP